MTFFLQVQVFFQEGWKEAHGVVANGAAHKGGGSQHVAVVDQVTDDKGKRETKDPFLISVATAGLEPEDAETAEITNAAISEHGYDG